MTEKIKKTFPVSEILQKLRFLVLDVDGVLTDGSIIYSSSGEELKTFNVKDGAALKYWARAGHRAGIVTGRRSSVVVRRAAELDIHHLDMGAKAKLPVFEKMLVDAGVTPEETVVIGDDLMELPLIRRAGLGVAVADAVPEVKEMADFVTQHPGGHGAVREVVELVLKAQGRWDGIMERYLV